MDRWLALLVAGLLGGAAGALAVDLVRGRAEPVPVQSGSGGDVGALGDVIARLERIESLARREPLAAAPATASLEGRAAGEGETAGADAEEARLQRIEARVEAAVERKAKELGLGRAPEGTLAAAPPAKRRVSLATAASEVGLSRSEEDAVRRAYDEATERMLKLMAGENGDVEEVRRDMEAAKTEKNRGMVMMKYLPRALPKIGELAAIGMERDAKVAEIVGPDRAERWEAFDVEEGNPFGAGGGIRMEARNR
jgi:hypothetical protein